MQLKPSFHATKCKAIVDFLTQAMQEKYASKYATNASDATANTQV